MEYKISAIIINDRLSNRDRICAIIKSRTRYRVTAYDLLSEAAEKSSRKRIDLVIISGGILSDNQSADLEEFFNLHPSAVPIIIYTNEQSTEYHNFKRLPNVGVSSDFDEHSLLTALNNANEIAKLKNQISRDKSEIIRLLYQLDKMRRQSAKGHKDDLSSTDLLMEQPLLAESTNLAEDLAISASLAKVFNQMNNFNLKKIATTLEKDLPDVLRIRKFSIFLLKNRLSKLELYACYNFPVQKKTELEISSLMESSIMFDAIFQRKVIHVNDYASTEFAKNQQDGNTYEHNNCLCIPLVSGKKIIGVANFNDSQFGHFSSQQINLILIFANYLAVILDNLQKKV